MPSRSRLDGMTDAPPALAQAPPGPAGVWFVDARGGVYLPVRTGRWGRPRTGRGRRGVGDDRGHRCSVREWRPPSRPMACPPACSSPTTSGSRSRRDSSRVAFRQVKATFGKAAHGDDERHVISFGKTTLIWDGHAATDSVTLTAPIERVWVLEGSRNRPVLLRWTVSAVSSRSMVGALVVQGKDRLAKVMRSSPIRYLGASLSGRNRAQLSEIPE